MMLFRLHNISLIAIFNLKLFFFKTIFRYNCQGKLVTDWLSFCCFLICVIWMNDKWYETQKLNQYMKHTYTYTLVQIQIIYTFFNECRGNINIFSCLDIFISILYIDCRLYTLIILISRFEATSCYIEILFLCQLNTSHLSVTYMTLIEKRMRKLLCPNELFCNK